ncbi:aminotransferase class I/II-fold pyridoxal phosphate-dependent enzyme [Ammonifex thiophilus]|nr:aminotransferase class I/II-fold pyridoxal phosphate-dependent enzyme [Ammonifex thiophilus]
MEEKKLRRYLHPLLPLAPHRALSRGREVVLFCSNNYLGLTHHPRVIAAAISALRVLEEDPEPQARLKANISRLAEGLKALGLPASGETPIFPVVLGSEGRALKVASLLFAKGFYVPAIRPPTVPPGTARLRVSVNALHTPYEIDSFLKALAETLKEV